MANIIRFGVSLEKEYFDKLEDYSISKKFNNRSQAIKNLIIENIIQKENLEKNAIAVGAITIVFEHHKRELTERLTHIQHDFFNIIISTQHIHLDHDNCFEIIALKGKYEDIENLFKTLKTIKGVKNCVLSLAKTYF